MSAQHRSVAPAAAFALAAALVFAAPAVAAPGPEAGRITGAVTLGVDVFGSGDLHGAAAGRAASLQALNPALPAVPADLNIQARAYDDVYDAPLSYGIEVGYGLSDDVELFGAISRSETDDGRVQVGSAFVPALNATLPIFGRFEGTTALLIEGGARYYLQGETFRPFVGARIGLARLDALRATFTIPDAPAGGITLANVPFFQETNALSLGAEAGVAIGFGDAVSGSLSAGVRRIGEFDGDDSVISTLGLASINDGTERVTFPISARLRIAF